MMSVSYTHLDVYKRQAHDCRDLRRTGRIYPVFRRLYRNAFPQNLSCKRRISGFGKRDRLAGQRRGHRYHPALRHGRRLCRFRRRSRIRLRLTRLLRDSHDPGKRKRNARRYADGQDILDRMVQVQKDRCV